MPTRPSRLVTVMIALAAALWPAAAGAAKPVAVTILDTFGPSNAYLVNVSDGALAPPGQNDQDFATSFITPSAPVRLGRLTVPLTTRFAAVPGDAEILLVPDTVTVNPTPSGDPTIHVPDTTVVLDRYLVRKVTQDWNGALYTVRSRRRPVLAPTSRYWLVLSTPTPGGQVAWYAGSETGGSLVAQRDSGDPYGFAWISTTRNQVSALRLEGTIP